MVCVILRTGRVTDSTAGMLNYAICASSQPFVYSLGLNNTSIILSSLEPRKHTLSAQLTAMPFSLSLSNAQNNDVFNDCGMLMKWLSSSIWSGRVGCCRSHLYGLTLHCIQHKPCPNSGVRNQTSNGNTAYCAAGENHTHPGKLLLCYYWECRSCLSSILPNLILVFVKWGLI